jgi:cysteine desulfurase
MRLAAGAETYLDGNAGMPLRPEARAVLVAALDAGPGNPSSAHAAGRRGRRLLSEAREAVAELVGARARDVVFTSGATEANVLAVRGALAAAGARRGLVTSRAEHTSLARLADRLAEEGVPVRRADADRSGRVDAGAFAALVDEATAAASLLLAQSVTGALEPVADVAARLAGTGTFLHSDAAQAAGRVPLHFGTLGVDALSLSAHKLGGPPGVGALVLREGAAWRAPHGEGSQEGGRRPGTEAVPLVAAFGAAARAARDDLDAFAARARRLVAPLVAFVRAAPGGEVITPAADALPGTALVAFAGCPGDALLAALDARGVRVSAGTACTSLARTPPEVLVAGGRSAEDAARAVRVSVAWCTSEDDVATLLAALRDVVPRVRAALATS